MKYLVYGQIDDIKDSTLHLSTGHRIRITASDLVNDEGQVMLKRGDTHFFHVEGLARAFVKNTFSFVESRRVADSDIPKIDVLSRNLEQQGAKCIKALEQLNKTDRCSVFRVVGIGVAGAVTLGNAAATIYETIEFFEGGPFNPMYWVTHAAVAVGGAVFTYMQYEELTEHLKARVDIVRTYQRVHQQYSQLMLKYMPHNSCHAEPLNPEVHSIMATLRPAFNAVRGKFDKFWYNHLGVNPEFCPEIA
jgi:hypothetical protein